MKKVLLFLVLILFICPLFSQSGQQNEIDRLKIRIYELEKRIEKLENGNSDLNSTDREFLFTDKWKNISNWRKLKQGMLMDQVETILGVPYRVDSGYTTYWFYDKNRSNILGPHVSFKGSTVRGWDEPR